MEIIVYTLIGLMALLALGTALIIKKEKKLNEHVLLAMSWLVDSESVGLSHLISNVDDARKKWQRTTNFDNWRAYRVAALVAAAACPPYEINADIEIAWTAVDKFFRMGKDEKEDYLAKIRKW